MQEKNINFTEEEVNLLKNALRDYENKHYDSISKEENNFIFNVLDKLESYFN